MTAGLTGRIPLREPAAARPTFGETSPGMSLFKPVFIPPVSLLETARLQIRIYTDEAYTERFRSGSDTELMTWFGFPDPDEAALQRAKVLGGFSTYESSCVQFLLELRESGQVIGQVSFHNWFQRYGRSELGYAMSSGRHNAQGYMREALPAVLRFGFDAMELNRVEAFISPDNEASLRLIGRLGFTQEGRLRQHYSHAGISKDSLLYALLREEWSGGPAT